MSRKCVRCAWCDEEVKRKNVVALARKLISVDTHVFYCLPCMADYFGCEVEALEEKIVEFKEQGCELFK